MYVPIKTVLQIFKKPFWLVEIVLFCSLFWFYSVDVQGKPLEVGFIFLNSVNDGGWSYSHEIARKKLKKRAGIKTAYLENVKKPYYRTMVSRFLAANQFDLVFTTSVMHTAGTLELAGQYPQTRFMMCSGQQQRKNVGTYFGRMYEARYLTGILAGLTTTNGKIGYVAAFKFPEVIRGINSFTLGVQSVNPSAKVLVKWTGQWSGDEEIRQPTLALIEEGVDVITQHQDSPLVQVIAEKHKVYTIGYHADMSRFAPHFHLVSAIWNWDPLYEEVIKNIRNGTWDNKPLDWGLAEGIVKLSPFGKMVNARQKNVVNRARDALIEKRLKIFTGPLFDQKGKLMLPPRAVLSKNQKQKIYWLVQGVVER